MASVASLAQRAPTARPLMPMKPSTSAPRAGITQLRPRSGAQATPCIALALVVGAATRQSTAAQTACPLQRASSALRVDMAPPKAQLTSIAARPAARAPTAFKARPRKLHAPRGPTTPPRAPSPARRARRAPRGSAPLRAPRRALCVPPRRPRPRRRPARPGKYAVAAPAAPAATACLRGARATLTAAPAQMAFTA
jgi:hypothetical protein